MNLKIILINKYYADIYIKSENKIIEVKSDYTMKKNMIKIWQMGSMS